MYCFQSKNIIKQSFYVLLVLIFVLPAASLAQEANDGIDAPAVTYNDQNIAQAIKEDLEVARGLNAKKVIITVDEGIAELSGTVSNMMAKKRAERIALSIKGVLTVVNNIKVEANVPDKKVSRMVENALESDNVTEPWEIGVSVENGTVILDGMVDSSQEKRLAAQVVASVKGVEAIRNNIKVDLSLDRTDKEIKENVKNALKWDSRIDDMLINVSVEQDTVQLLGAVGSAWEKQLAIEKAHVIGVRHVNGGMLAVKPWARDKMQRTEENIDLTPTQKEVAIQNAIARDPRILSQDITVEVDEGIATIKGTVATLKAKNAAAQDAYNTIGVWMVDEDVKIDNQLVIEPSVVRTDKEIKKDVKQAIQRDPYLEPADVKVSVTNGVVTLSGNAESHFEKNQAYHVTSGTMGVVGIENNLKVEYDPFAMDRTQYEQNPILDDIDFMPMAVSGQTLEDRVRSQIQWSPFITVDDITVSVKDSTVILEGTVSNRFEFQEITEEAYEAGAKYVKNRAEIKNTSSS